MDMHKLSYRVFTRLGNLNAIIFLWIISDEMSAIKMTKVGKHPQNMKIEPGYQ